ncbi:MAG: S8 family serine peptidase, partial [Candidatus Omnitrophota bacterium]
NSEGIIGVAPDAKILPVKVLDDTGWGGWAGVARGIKYAADMGANIINLSLGGWGYAHPDSFFYSMVSYAVNKGCVIVAAAGNSNTDVKYFLPANIPEVIAVSATTGLNDRRAHFSNYGSGIDVAAPGVNILSLRAADTGLNGAYSFLPSWDPQAEYRKLSGTSMAAPFVSGVAALLLADNPKLSSDEVRAKLRFSAEDLGAPGFDKYFGYGRLDAYEALIYGKPGYEDSLEIAVGEGQEKSQIKGVDINEVISMQEAQRQNQMDFTGYSPKENFQQPPGALK